MFFNSQDKRSEPNVRVFVRVKPSPRLKPSLVRVGNDSVLLSSKPGDTKQYTFDWVADETSTQVGTISVGLTIQEEVFSRIGIPVVQNCLEGYNGV